MVLEWNIMQLFTKWGHLCIEVQSFCNIWLHCSLKIIRFRSSTSHVNVIIPLYANPNVFQDAYHFRLLISAIAMQETHCDYNTLDAWKKEWGGESVWTHYASDQAGVAILFNSKLNVNILGHTACTKGRTLAVTAEI